MKRKMFFLLLYLVLLAGCNDRLSAETGPFVGLEAGGESVAVALHYTTEGILKVTGSYAHTLIRSGSLRMGWEAAVDYVLSEAKHRKYTLYIVYRKPNGEVYQDVYDIGKPFQVTFTEQEHVEVIKSSEVGSVVVIVNVKPEKVERPSIESPASSTEQSMSQSAPPATRFPTSTPTERSSTCAFSPRRLKVGGYAQVCTFHSGDPVRIRNGPGKWYSYDHELRTGAVVYVLEGPVCDEDSGWWYWKIETRTRHYIGWMAEGGDEKDPYFLCPYP